MIKGVHKNVIEIKGNNDNFEKIIIVLKNTPQIPNENELIEQALLMTGKLPHRVSRSSKMYTIIMSSISGAIFALCCCAAMLLFV